MSAPYHPHYETIRLLRAEVEDLKAQLSRQSAEVEALREALCAKMQLEGRGGKPRKLDEALAWIQNDEKAERMAQEALALSTPPKTEEADKP